MSLTALKMANAGNPLSRFVNSPKLPLICATGLATLHFVLAFNITRLRVAIGPQPDKLARGTPFDFSRRTQMNVAEYSGALLALLLFIQYKTDSGSPISKFGKFGALLSLFGSYTYTYGYSSQTDEQTAPLRVLGAVSRYVGMALMCVQLYKYTKA